MKHKAAQTLLYVVLVLLLLLLTAGVAFMLTPLIMLGNTLVAYSVTIVLGLVLGMFIVMFIADLEIMTHAHHVALWIIVSAGSALSFATILVAAARFVGNTDFVTDPAIMGLVFAACFLLPYAFSLRHLAERHARMAKFKKHP